MGIFQHVDNIATEVIDHQYNNDEFKASLIEVVSTILQKIEAGIYKDTFDVVKNVTEIDKIVDLIKKRTGITIRFIKDQAILNAYSNNAAIIPFTNNIFNPMIKPEDKESFFDLDLVTAGKELEQSMTEQIKKLSRQPSVVDAKKGFISGGYADLVFDIIVDFKGLSKSLKMTASEIAAVIMHEIGHVFTWLHFNNKLVVINEALYNIHSAVKKADEDKRYSIVYQELKTIDGKITEKQVKDMISGNVLSASMAYYDFITRNTEFSNLCVSLGNRNNGYNSETVADQFAVRMGFGDSLFTALNKISKTTNGSLANFMIMTLMVDLFMVYLLLPLIILSPVLLAYTTAIAATISLLLNSIMSIIGDNTYKYDRERLQKVVNETIDSVKDVKDVAFKKAVISNVKMMKSVINKLPDEHGAMSKFFMMISKNTRIEQAYSAQQDLLERIASNELFVKAVELELQSKGK